VAGPIDRFTPRARECGLDETEQPRDDRPHSLRTRSSPCRSRACGGMGTSRVERLRAQRAVQRRRPDRQEEATHVDLEAHQPVTGGARRRKCPPMHLASLTPDVPICASERPVASVVLCARSVRRGRAQIGSSVPISGSLLSVRPVSFGHRVALELGDPSPFPVWRWRNQAGLVVIPGLDDEPCVVNAVHTRNQHVRGSATWSQRRP